MKDFKYLEKINVIDCHTKIKHEIIFGSDEKFNHLILTGKNGSGKTTILKALDKLLIGNIQNLNIPQELSMPHQYDPLMKEHRDRIKEDFFLSKSIEISPKIRINSNEIYGFFNIERNTNNIAQIDINRQDQKFNPTFDSISSQFKNYLFIKERYKRDYFYENKTEDPKIIYFYKKMDNLLKKILGDEFEGVGYEKSNLGYYGINLRYQGGIIKEFNQLPAGYSAAISILLDLLIKIDLILEVTSNSDKNPSGIVIIDEPETHLHLELQYEFMPILVEFFPNIQFIIATHSPAIVSSLKYAVTYDLSTQSHLNEMALGSSFSELMVSHFNLDNEYSPFTDNIFNKINKIKIKFKNDPINLKDEITSLLSENRKYLSPGLILDLESTLSLIENDKY